MLTLLVFSSSPFAYAAADVPEVQITVHSNGYYYETVIEDEPTPLSPLMKAATKTTTKKKSKTTYYKNSAGKVMWYVKVTGTFKYGNGSATCTAASVKAASENSAWTVHDASASRSGNAAIGSATGKQHDHGLIINTVKQKVTLKCSATGQFS